MAWLEGADIDPAHTIWSRPRRRVYLSVEATVAEMLLSTKVYSYYRAASKHGLAGFEKYFIPDPVSRYVQHILPCSMRRPNRGLRHMETSDRDTLIGCQAVDWTCHDTMSPDCVRAVYKIPFQLGHYANSSFGICLPASSVWIG